jgi:hypothetical protein
MRASFFSGLCDAGRNSVAQNIPFKFRKDGMHADERPAARCGHVERLGQGNKSDFER